MSIQDFLDRVEAPTRSLVVANRTAPDPVQRMLADTFAGQPVAVSEEDLPDEPSDCVLLVERTDAGPEVVASSPLSALQDAVLLVNSDLYRTGAFGLDEFELPAVLAGLDETPFRLRGYPHSHKEKLLLITVSRYIERRAWAADGGRLRSSFQRLSRIDDEQGTREVYEALAESPVQTHVYGRPDWRPSQELDVIEHAGHTEDFRDAWFVVHEADDPAALLAVEVEDRVWEGFWTFRPALVADVAAYVARNL